MSRLGLKVDLMLNRRNWLADVRNLVDTTHPKSHQKYILAAV